jgi:CHASE3 domain sensor protein
MLSLDEIGAYLSAIATDQVPDVDKLSTKDKIPILKMLIELNELKKDCYDNPQIIEAVKLEEDVKQLSVKAIKNLIDASYDTTENEKEDIIKSLNADNSLSKEDIEFLQKMNKDELLNLLTDLSDKKKGETNEN